jgi:hypothetical protein
MGLQLRFAKTSSLPRSVFADILVRLLASTKVSSHLFFNISGPVKETVQCLKN